jgi:hypothetical protein
MSELDQDAGATNAPPKTEEPSHTATDIAQRRRYLIAALAVLISIIFALVHFAGESESTVPTGPVAAGEAAPGTPVQPAGPLRLYGGYGPLTAKVDGPDEVVSTSLSTFYNATASPVTITNFEPIDAKGVDLLGVKFAFDGPGYTPYVNGKGFPDPTALKLPDAKIFELSDVNPIKPFGNEISDKAPDDTLLWAIVGMRLRPGLKSGSLGGIALDYTDGAATHRLELLGPRKLCISEGCT